MFSVELVATYMQQSDLLKPCDASKVCLCLHQITHHVIHQTSILLYFIRHIMSKIYKKGINKVNCKNLKSSVGVPLTCVTLTRFIND